MPLEMPASLVLVVGLTWLFAFSNGFHDAANVVATMISTRALSAEWAVVLAVAGEFLGALFLGQAVIMTVSQRLLTSATALPAPSGVMLVAAALLGATAWNIMTWRWGLPISSSHALLGGVVGSGLAAGGTALIQWRSVGWVAGFLIAAPVGGAVVAFLLMRFGLLIGEGMTPQANAWLKGWQWVSSFALAVAHGGNDAPKSIGMLVLALGFLTGTTITISPLSGTAVAPPLWVLLSCAGALACGAATGGWRLMKTLGMRLYRMRPIHGVCAQVSTAALVCGSTAWGIPISTTQIIASAVIGTGAAEHPRAVRWRMVGELAMAWLVTIPISGLFGATSFWVFRWVSR